MKKTLLLAAVATLSLSANAQGWTAPVVPTEGSEVVSGHKYRIKNVAASQNDEGKSYFYSGASTWYGWATSSALVDGSTTTPETFTLTETEKGWTFARGDGKYTFISAQTAGGFVNSGEMHVDQGSQAENLRYFGLVKNDSYYRIHAAKENTAQGISVFDENGEPTLFWGWKTDNLNGESNKFPWAVYGTVSPDEGFACDWEFIDYSLYSARVALYNLYVNASDYGVDCSSEQAVYDSADASLNELEDARISLAKKLAIAKAEALLADASEENPKDATELLENPDFSNGTINGWVCTFVKGVTATNIGYQQNAVYNGLPWTDDETGESGTATCNKFIEAWAQNVDAMKRNGNNFATVGDGKLYQIIYGLPAGKYKLSCNAQAKQQYDATQNPVTGVQLYAVAGEFDNYKNMATGNDGPVHFIMEFVHSGGDVELGLRTQMSTANWICADDFKLVYYGEIKENPYQILLKKAVAEAESTYTLDEVKASAEAKNIYTTALEAAKAAEDEQEDAYYQELQTKLENAISALNVSANLMVQLVAAYNAAEEKFNIVKSRCEIDCRSVADELAYISGGIDSGFKTDAMIKMAIDDVTNYISTLFTKDILDAKNAASATVENPVDITAVISNSTYDWSAAGGSSAYWTNTGKAPHGWNTNGHKEDGGTFVVAEVWDGTFTHTQQISGLIPGYYALQVNAFQRGAGNNEHSKQAAEESGEPLTASLFAGEGNSIPVASVFSEVDKYDEIFANENGIIPGATIEGGKFNGKVVPNSMTEATNAFNAGLYVNVLQFEVKEGQSVVEFGLSKEVMQGNDWVIFGNWNLKYYGTKNPNTPTAITDVNAAPAAKAIYDLTGRKVSKAVKGIYVINNKKVVK